MPLTRAQMAFAIRTYARAAPSRVRPFEPLPPAPVTLPAVTLRDLSDQDVGLPHDPVAQDRAERFLRAAIARRLRQDQAARRVPVATMPVEISEPVPCTSLARKQAAPVHVTVPDESLVLIQPTDTIEDIEADIAAEFRRLAAMPRAHWLS